MTEFIGTGKHLKPEQYWYWRYLISDWKRGELEAKIELASNESMAKDIELLRLRQMLHKNKVKNLIETATLLEKNYKDYKDTLEKDLGVTLNNTVIDDVTFEIKNISEEK